MYFSELILIPGKRQLLNFWHGYFLSHYFKLNQKIIQFCIKKNLYKNFGIISPKSIEL